MQLEEFFDYKNQLMKDLLTSEEVVKLVSGLIPVSDPFTLAYSQIFPFEYVPETVEDARTFICFDVDIQRAYNKTYFQPTIYIWVFTHKSLLKLPEGGVRTDKLCSEIAKLINGSRYYGLGELELQSVKRFAPMTDFQGKCITLHATDFNRQYDPKRPTPSNRKNN